MLTNSHIYILSILLLCLYLSNMFNVCLIYIRFLYCIIASFTWVKRIKSEYRQPASERNISLCNCAPENVRKQFQFMLLSHIFLTTWIIILCLTFNVKLANCLAGNCLSGRSKVRETISKINVWLCGATISAVTLKTNIEIVNSSNSSMSS